MHFAGQGERRRVLVRFQDRVEQLGEARSAAEIPANLIQPAVIERGQQAVAAARAPLDELAEVVKR